MGAALYAAGRPYFHPIFMARLSLLLRGRALGADVACGTGLSSVALSEVVQEVHAFDLAAPMLERAAPHPRITYAQAAAEALPLPDHCLDVLSAAQAFYWFDHAQFLPEARRVLRPEGVLFVYDFYWTGQMLHPDTAQDDPLFAEFAARYMTRYPKKAQARSIFGPQEATQHGFLLQQDHFLQGWSFTLEQLVAFLLSQPQVLCALQRGEETPAEAEGWLTQEMAGLFDEHSERQLQFQGWQMALWPLDVVAPSARQNV